MKEAVRRKRSKKKEQGREQRTHRRTAAREQWKSSGSGTKTSKLKKAVEQRRQGKRKTVKNT
jgi:hypothetical protein